MSQTTGSLIFSTPAPLKGLLYVCLRDHSRETFVVQPQDLESQPEGRSSSPPLLLEEGRGSPPKHREDLPAPGLIPKRHIIQCQARSRGLSLVSEVRIGTAHTPAWDPCIPPSHPRLLCPQIPSVMPPSPQTCLGSVRAISSPLLSFSATRTQQIPMGPEGGRVKCGSGVGGGGR